MQIPVLAIGNAVIARFNIVAVSMCFSLIIAALTLLGGCLTPHRIVELTEQEVPVVPGLSLITLELGEGVPVVFVDDMPGDGSSWGMQLGDFSGAGFRAIEYGRRYHEIEGHLPVTARLAERQVRELSCLFGELNLSKVHLVAHGYGGQVALLFAMQHPDRVRTLTLCEPTLYAWLSENARQPSETRQTLRQTLTAEMIQPVRDALLAGDDDVAIQRYLDFTFLDGASNQWLSPEIRQRYRSNAAEFKAVMLSEEPYSTIDMESLRRLSVPTLLLSSEYATPINAFICEELDRLLPAEAHQRVVINGAGHWMWQDQPEACRAEVIQFIKESPGENH